MKKYMFAVILVLTLIVLFLLPINIFKPSIKIDYEIEKEKEPTYIYYVAENEVLGIPIYDIEENEYKRIKEIFLYFTEKSNSVSEKYDTYINLNTKLLSYEINQENLFLEVSDDFFQMESKDSNYALAQILFTYQELGFKNIFLKYNGKIVSEVFSNPTYDGISNVSVNVVYKANTTNTKTIRVVYSYKDNTKGFVNYITNKTNEETTFILQDLVAFINREYGYNIKLISHETIHNRTKINIIASESERNIVEKVIDANIKGAIYDFKAS